MVQNISLPEDGKTERRIINTLVGKTYSLRIIKTKENNMLIKQILAITEAKWSAAVKEKWHPPEGFFTKSASAIATGLKAESKDLKQAMSRLNFYINRAGINLSADDIKRLENAKEKLRALYK